MSGYVLLRQVAGCAVRTVRLLGARRLHIRHALVGAEIALPDGRRYDIFRETTCDTSSEGVPVVLAVWFRLRAVPPGARLRRRVFEALCIVNTLLFAGFDGYLVKLWMVNPATSDYAGLYSWTTHEKAETYGRYITSVLRPLSTPGSTGFRVFTEWTLSDYLDPPVGTLTALEER